MDVDKLVNVYLKIREKRSQIRKEYEAQDDALKEKLDTIESALLKHLQNQNAQSVKTGPGTVYTQRDVVPACFDWDAFHRWVLKNGELDALERRVKKGFITDLIEQQRQAAIDNGEDAESIELDLPPGVQIHERRVVRVRKS